MRPKSLSHWVNQSLLQAGMIGLILLGLFPTASAATLCVAPSGTGGCYPLPSAAVAAAADGDTILIHSGTYMESGSISIVRSNLKIIGDNPTDTKVTNPTLSSVFLFPSGANASAEIANLTITGGLHGVEIRTGNGSVSIHHNNIEFNSGSGITTSGCCGGLQFIAFNNVVRSNGGYGINGYNASSTAVYNNIVAKNGSYGIAYANANYNSSYSNGASGTSNFTYTSGNIGNISLDCLFVDEVALDYRLQSISPCKDAGNPGYLDVDGTRSDMGSFGGPSAALFWPYGNGGPVVTNLTVSPPIVPEGGTLSIKATVEIR